MHKTLFALPLLVVAISMLAGCNATHSGVDQSLNHPENSVTPFVYDTWKGFPEKINGQVAVRLKAYCKPDHRWYLNAIVHPSNGKQTLTAAAWNHLNTLDVPSETCTPNQSIGTATWFPDTDRVVNN